jgi:beta-lactamase regulating signal transducer with metallopeptidase domain
MIEVPISIQAIIDGVIHYGALTLIHGTVLALLTWLLSATILRRSRPAFQAALWTIVLLKFLLPPVLPGEMALSGWLAEAATSVTVTQLGHTELSSEPINRESSINDGQIATVESRGNQAVRLLFICYLVFVAVLGVNALVMLRRTGHRIRSLPSADVNTLNEVLRLSEWIGLKRMPDVRATNDEMTPYVFGFRRSVLVLPERLMRMLDTSERRGLILHELAHIRRKDQLIRGLQGLAGVFFFFFPPVLWVSRRVEHFTEMACDRWAIAGSEVAPCTYAGAVVKVVKELRRMPQPQVGLPLVRGVRLLEERLRAVLRVDARKSPRLSLTAKMLLTCWSLFVLMGGSTAKGRQPTPNLPPAFTSNAQEVSSRPETVRNNGSHPIAPPEYSKGTGRKQSVSPGESEPSPQQTKTANQYESGQETKISREARVAAELRAFASRSQQPSAGKTLGPYEEGYLLGSRYAQERASRSQTESATEGAAIPDHRSREREAKREIEMREIEMREIEMRMQALTKRPSRQ